MSDRTFLTSRLAQAIERAGGTHDLRRDVGPMLMDGRAQWWGGGDAAIVTEMLDYPNLRAVNYWLVAGRLAPALALQGRIDAWARAQGATVACAVGRPGWSRVLAPYGWEAWGVAYRKPLGEGEA